MTDSGSAEISVMVRHDEAAYIEASKRCAKCGHLGAFHGDRFYNLERCGIPGCGCRP